LTNTLKTFIFSVRNEYPPDSRKQAKGSVRERIMSGTYDQILRLIKQGRLLVSEHGYDELAADGIFVRDVLCSVAEAAIVEEYPTYPKGPCVLLLQRDRNGNPIHVVWGIPKDRKSPAVLVTAYRPDLKRWEADFLRRKK